MTFYASRKCRAADLRITALLLAVFAIGGVIGCSESPPPVPSDGNRSSANVNESTSDAEHSDKVPTNDAGGNDSGGSHLTADGTKWIGDIPYDVWYDNPLEVVNTEGDVASSSMTDDGLVANIADAANGKSEQPSGSQDDEATSKGDGAADWAALLPEAVIESEIKRIRNDLNNGLQSVSQYNAHYKEIQVDGATLSVLAAIVPNHPAMFTWKPNAKHVRNLGNQITVNSTALGRKAFDATKEPFEKVVSVLSGNIPPDLEEVPETVSLSEAVKRGDVMKRMQISYDWMKKNVPAENVLMEEGERIRHEAALLATMGTIINDKSYFLSDEESYRQYAQTLINSCQDVIDASNNGEFDAYTGALDKIYKACNDCHVDWRGE